MPEAAVDEDDGFVFGEDDVGFAGKVFDMEAEAVAHLVEEGTNEHLGLGAFAFDPGHVPTTAGFGETVFQRGNINKILRKNEGRRGGRIRAP